MSENAKLQRTIDRFKAKINEGAFYEAHQNIRTIANRYIKAKKFKEAIDILYQGATVLLEAKQYASGSDLISYLTETYVESATPVDTESRSKLIQLLTLLKDDDPSLKQLGKEIIKWSIDFGDVKVGDADLHHVLGVKLLKQDEFYDAELHLIMGTSESLPAYINYLSEWYLQDAPDKASVYLSRIVMNYLYVKNIRHLKIGVSSFINKITESGRLNFTEIKDDDLSIYQFPDDIGLDFLQLLVLTVQRNSKDLFIRLQKQYNSTINALGLPNHVAYIGSVYFDIAMKSQNNFLQDIMSGFFK